MRMAQRISELKGKLRSVPEREVMRARSLANPCENVCFGYFKNRSSVELACIDYLFRITAQNKDSKSLTRFIDAGGEFGGASEYLLWRLRSIRAKGHGWVIGRSKSSLLNPKFCMLDNISCQLTFFGKDSEAGMLQAHVIYIN